VPPRARSLRSTRATSIRKARLFTRRIQVAADDGSAVTKGAVSCGARLRRAPLRVARKGWLKNAAYCTWRLPRRTRRALLRGVVRVDSQGLHVMHRFTTRLR